MDPIPIRHPLALPDSHLPPPATARKIGLLSTSHSTPSFAFQFPTPSSLPTRLSSGLDTPSRLLDSHPRGEDDDDERMERSASESSEGSDKQADEDEGLAFAFQDVEMASAGSVNRAGQYSAPGDGLCDR
jgi:hypothetical protein